VLGMADWVKRMEAKHEYRFEPKYTTKKESSPPGEASKRYVIGILESRAAYRVGYFCRIGRQVVVSTAEGRGRGLSKEERDE
jgi:hypothetical protein